MTLTQAKHGLDLGLEPANPLIDPFAAVASSAMIGEATFINAGSVGGGLAMIGSAVLINRGATVGHHCILENFVSIAPGATLASNIKVGEGAVIATAATFLPNIRIGAGAVVSGGTLIRSDVPDHTLVAGSPAKYRPYRKSQSSLLAQDEE